MVDLHTKYSQAFRKKSGKLIEARLTKFTYNIATPLKLFGRSVWNVKIFGCIRFHTLVMYTAGNFAVEVQLADTFKIAPYFNIFDASFFVTICKCIHIEASTYKELYILTVSIIVKTTQAKTLTGWNTTNQAFQIIWENV